MATQPSNHKERDMSEPYRPPVEKKEFKTGAGQLRTWVRYQGQKRWYKGVANAQIAHQFGRDLYIDEATHLRNEANRALDAREESWQRSDTDGFLSQWAHGLTAQLKLRQAEIVEAGGVSEFPALLDAATGERVRAKLVYVADRFQYGRKVAKWIVLDASDRAEHWVPAFKTGKQSTLAKMGLVEGREVAPATAFIDGEGRGLSGTAWVAVKRTDGGFPEGTRTLAEIRRS